MDIDGQYSMLTKVTDFELAGVCQLEPQNMAKHFGREDSEKESWVQYTHDGSAAVPRGSVVGRNLLRLGDKAKEVLGLRQLTAKGAVNRKLALTRKMAGTKKDFGTDPDIPNIVKKLKQADSLTDEHLDWQAEAALTTGNKVADRDARERARGFREWAKRATSDNCKQAHKWARPAIGKIEDLKGVGNRPLGMQATADKLAEKWRSEVWRQGQPATGVIPINTPPPQLPSHEELKGAAAYFPKGTATSNDGFRPHWCSWLSKEALEAHGRLFTAMEIQGRIPSQLFTTIVFIPKADGGVRPIGLLPTWLRFWERTRRGQAKDWEKKTDKGYWAGSTGKSAEHTAWEHNKLCEYAEAAGIDHVSVFMDMAKAYEKIPHALLEAQCQKAGFPPYIIRVCLAVYGGLRRCAYGKAVSGLFTVESSICCGILFCHLAPQGVSGRDGKTASRSFPICQVCHVCR